jgi:thymidylate synthase
MYIEREYLKLLKDILSNGVEKQDRTGTGTLSVFGRQIRHSMSKGFPLLTTKKMPMRLVATELLWFLRGDTNIKFLHDYGCHIWDGDYEKSGRTDGELGPIYGKQWRDWNSSEAEFEGLSGVDQIQILINDLKTNPDSRRLMVNAWNVGELEQMVLPPCHYGFQVYTRELSLEERRKLANHDSIVISPITVESWDRNNIPTRAISLMWNQRSVDTFLGLPFNIASYALLLEIIAKATNMVPDELIGNLGDVHLYSNHIDQAKEQLTREPMPLSKLNINTEFWPTESGSCGEGILDAVAIFDGFKDDNFCRSLLEEDIQLSNYQSHPAIKAPLSN